MYTRNPKQTDARKREAQALIARGQFQQAGAVYREICRLTPDDAEAWFVFGALCGQVGNINEAVQCCRRAVELRPDYPEAHYNLAQAYKRLNMPLKAESSFREAVRLKPDYAEAWDNLGYLLQERGLQEEAVRCYREALRLRPDFAGTRYLLAAQGEVPAPEKAPPEYVRGLFDNYADRFEQHLMNELECRIPQQLERAVNRVLGTGSGRLNVLDLGCGTGLCGPWLRRHARRLLGVDLAPRMIAKTREKKIYDELRVEDVVQTLRSSGAVYDLVVAADVFPYLGDLASLFQACGAALRIGGLFAFSVESDDRAEGYVLRKTDRYAHSATYIRKLADAAGFKEVSRDEVVLRKHKGAPVTGYIFVYRIAPAEPAPGR